MQKIDPKDPSKVVIIHKPPVHDNAESTTPAGEGTATGEPVSDKSAEEKTTDKPKG